MEIIMKNLYYYLKNKINTITETQLAIAFAIIAILGLYNMYNKINHASPSEKQQISKITQIL
jgi:putative Mn2+ efflux pump MntP